MNNVMRKDEGKNQPRSLENYEIKFSQIVHIAHQLAHE